MICSLQIHYRTTKLKRICENAEETKKAYGSNMADKIQMRISELSAADSVDFLVKYNIGRCHLLKGNRRGQYAMDLVQPYRLVFIQEDNVTVSVLIEQIVDYH